MRKGTAGSGWAALFTSAHERRNLVATRGVGSPAREWAGAPLRSLVAPRPTPAPAIRLRRLPASRLREELVGRLLNLLRRQILGVLRQPPAVAERILDESAAVAPELVGQRHDDFSAGVDGALPGRIHVVAIDEEADRCAAQRLRPPCVLLDH